MLDGYPPLYKKASSWTVFLSLSVVCLAVGIAKGGQSAASVDALIDQHRTRRSAATDGQETDDDDDDRGVPGIRLLNVSLVFVSLCYFYLSLLLSVLMLYGVSYLVHVMLDVVIRDPVNSGYANESPAFAMAEWALSPGTMFDFLSWEYWGVHAVIFAVVLVVTVAYTMVFVPADGKRQRQQEQERVSVVRTFQRTARAAVSAPFYVLYGLLIARDVINHVDFSDENIQSLIKSVTEEDE